MMRLAVVAFHVWFAGLICSASAAQDAPRSIWAQDISDWRQAATGEEINSYALSRFVDGRADNLFDAASAHTYAQIVANDGDYQLALQLFDIAIEAYEADILSDRFAETLREVSGGDPAGMESRLQAFTDRLSRMRSQRPHVAGLVGGQAEEADEWRAFADRLLMDATEAERGGDYRAAEAHLRRARRIYRWTGPRSLEADTSYSLGVLIESSSAIPAFVNDSYIQALAIWEDAATGDRDRIVHARSWLARDYLRTHYFDGAEDEYRQLSAMAEADGDREARAEWLTGLGEALIRQGRYGEAETVLLQALDLRVGQSPETATAQTLLYLSESLLAQGRTEEALALQTRALGLFDGDPSNDTATALSVLDRLADVHLESGNLEAGEDVLRRSLSLRESTLPSRDISIGRNLAQLALLVQRAGRQEEALELVERALAIIQNQSGLLPDHEVLTDGYLFVGLARYGLGDSQRAERHLDFAYIMREHLLGSGHPALEPVSAALAGVYLDLGSYEEALAYARSGSASVLARSDLLLTDAATRDMAAVETIRSRELFELRVLASYAAATSPR